MREEGRERERESERGKERGREEGMSILLRTYMYCQINMSSRVMHCTVYTCMYAPSAYTCSQKLKAKKL